MIGYFYVFELVFFDLIVTVSILFTISFCSIPLKVRNSVKATCLFAVAITSFLLGFKYYVDYRDAFYDKQAPLTVTDKKVVSKGTDTYFYITVSNERRSADILVSYDVYQKTPIKALIKPKLSGETLDALYKP